MDITPLIPKTNQIITAYGNGSFKVNGQAYKGSLIIFPTNILVWDVSKAQDITLASLDAIRITETVEIVLVGTGPSIEPLAPEIKTVFRAQSIAMEVMDTGAACRTYNVLLAEGRQVAAALIAV